MPSSALHPQYRGPLLGVVGLALFLPQLLPLISEEASHWSFFVGHTVNISWVLGLLGMGMTVAGGIVSLNELMRTSRERDAQSSPAKKLLNLGGCLCPILAASAFVVAFLSALNSVTRWN
jgi:hypothetical protein